MPEPNEAVREDPPLLRNEDREIRDRVRELTSQALQQGQFDPEAIRDIVRAITGQKATHAVTDAADMREAFADAVREFDRSLLEAASSTHAVLQQLASRGKDFTNNDLKEALVSLRKLEENYVAATNHIAEAMTGNLRREMMELAVHAQQVGVEASARVAGLVGEFASRMGQNAASGLETMRGTSVRMALLTSGMLAGVADALRDMSAAKKGP